MRRCSRRSNPPVYRECGCGAPPEAPRAPRGLTGSQRHPPDRARHAACESQRRNGSCNFHYTWPSHWAQTAREGTIREVRGAGVGRMRETRVHFPLSPDATPFHSHYPLPRAPRAALTSSSCPFCCSHTTPTSRIPPVSPITTSSCPAWSPRTALTTLSFPVITPSLRNALMRATTFGAGGSTDSGQSFGLGKQDSG